MDSMCITDSNEELTGSGSTSSTTRGEQDYCEGLAPPDANASWGAFTSALPTTWGAADQCEGQDDADMSASAAPPLLLTTVTMPSPLLEGQPPQPISKSKKATNGLTGKASAIWEGDYCECYPWEAFTHCRLQRVQALLQAISARHKQAPQASAAPSPLLKGQEPSKQPEKPKKATNGLTGKETTQEDDYWERPHCQLQRVEALLTAIRTRHNAARKASTSALPTARRAAQPLPERPAKARKSWAPKTPGGRQPQQRQRVAKLVIMLPDYSAVYAGMQPTKKLPRADVLGGKSKLHDRAVGNAAYGLANGLSDMREHAAAYFSLCKDEVDDSGQRQNCLSRFKLLVRRLMRLVRMARQVLDVAQRAYGAPTKANLADAATLVRECDEELPKTINRAWFWANLEICSVDATATKKSESWSVLFAKWVGTEKLPECDSLAVGELRWRPFKKYCSMTCERAFTAKFWSTKVTIKR